jgi:hypothetical protein
MIKKTALLLLLASFIAGGAAADDGHDNSRNHIKRVLLISVDGCMLSIFLTALMA